MTGDIFQAYNAIKLQEDHWQYQRILLNENMDLSNPKVIEAVVVTAIYGVRCVGAQLEVVRRDLAEQYKSLYPKVYVLLKFCRYIDDFGKSTKSREETKKLISDCEQVLSSASMKVKGWTQSGQDPPSEVTPDGSSIQFAGVTWFPKLDIYKLNIQSLHYGKKNEEDTLWTLRGLTEASARPTRSSHLAT